jgi:CIC family chloride channel protein
VLDEAGRYLGVVTARGVAEALSDDEHDDQLAEEILEWPEPVRVDETLQSGLARLEASMSAAVPVLDPAGEQLVGWLTPQEVLAALRAS